MKEIKINVGLERKAEHIMKHAELENHAVNEDEGKIYEQYRFPTSQALFEITMDMEIGKVLEIEFLP